MRYDLVIFDLDGTILNTLYDLRSALNTVLAQEGFEQHSLEEVRRFVGNGAAKLIARALPAGTSAACQEDVLRKFKEFYSRNANLNTVPYRGVPEMLSSLKAAGIALACNSNKFDGAVYDLCQTHYPGMFSLCMGDLPDRPKKPDPYAANHIMEELRVSRARTLYVGDSDVDLATAKNAGVDGAWVTWGFRKPGEICIPKETPVFDAPEDLTRYILEV